MKMLFLYMKLEFAGTMWRQLEFACTTDAFLCSWEEIICRSHSQFA